MKALSSIILPLAGAQALILPRQTTLPSEFTPNPSVGWGGARFTDSPHFRVYNSPSPAAASSVIASLEAAYACFVRDLGWRSTGLSFLKDTDEAPFYKLNVYTVDESITGGSPANTGMEWTYGMSFLNVLPQYVTVPGVTVHEFGHALTYAERYWIEQSVTGAWWETVANFVADTYLTSDLCGKARGEYGQEGDDTLIDLGKTIGDAHQVIVDGSRDTGNYYQAWPFLAYLHNNPDNYTGLGLSTFPDVWTKYKRDSNETPLHVIERIAAPTKIQTVVGRYWARMAYVDIGHPKARAKFEAERGRLNYQNLDTQGNGRYRVKPARQPRYMGANIIPLRGSGLIAVTVTAPMPFTATLAVKDTSGDVRYSELSNGVGTVSLSRGEEATLVVANTPDSLINFDPFNLSPEVNRGLDYTIELTGAMP